MKKLLLAYMLLGGLAAIHLHAQTMVERDPEISSMAEAVNADSLQSYIKTLVSFGTRHTLSSSTDPKRGIGAARNWVLSKFREFAKNSGGRLTAVIDTTTWTPAVPPGKQPQAPVPLADVVATLKGTDPRDNRIFVISGHIDSRNSNIQDNQGEAPGANDDGSGCAAVLECARILSAHPFPATIVFVTVSGEEQGLWGASYMAKKAKTSDWPVEAVLNNDIVGSNHSNGTSILNNTQVRVFSEGLPAWDLDKQARMLRQLGLENDGRARQLARYVKETGERYVDNLQVVLIYRNDRFLRGGDHTPWVENGYAAVRITEMNEDFTHQHQDLRTENGVQYGDLPEFIDYGYLRKNAMLNLVSLANLASAPGVPAEVKIDTRELSNQTKLSWRAPVQGLVKGYYVLIRETTSPVWQRKFYTTGTALTLPYSKDNYLFAVQSVSAGGHESLAVVPVPDNGR